LNKDFSNGVFHLGIDIGSVSINTVLMNSARDILWEDYTRTKGRPLESLVEVLERVFKEAPYESIASCSFTGIGGNVISRHLNAVFINEIIAQTKAVEWFHPEVRTIIEMGGEDAKLILVDSREPGALDIIDFAMNTLCAAGTGSFLDQQAHRLGYSIEEFSKLALKSKTPPRIAGRCSVFAKTDMIHLQQGATPDFEIIAGLCFAMARNLKSNIGKGKKILKPVIFQGGVAANLGVRRAFEEVLEIKKGELIIPKHFASMGAIGAVIKTLEDGPPFRRFKGVPYLKEYIVRNRVETKRHPPLISKGAGLVSKIVKTGGQASRGKALKTRLNVYLGIDVGSISTKVVLIDENKRLIAKTYLMTAGRPLEAIKEGLRIIGEGYGDLVQVVGAATTGSGRYLTGDFIGADLVRNEITAQAAAAADIDPEVDTIFEIGGQDSKYISLENGTIVDFMMNKVCAAGTGSFLEEQAEKLGLSIKEEFGNMALKAKEPVLLGERCTVFMESDLVHYQQQGCSKEDLVAGLCYSIVENYLNRVVEHRKIGDRIFYQGATAFNRGIVAAFEKVLGKPIVVPEHCDVTGAIGAALLARRERSWDRSRFKGFELSKLSYAIESFECKKCPNQCEIRKVTVEGGRPLFYGSRCDRYDVNRDRKEAEKIPDLFKEREEWLLKSPFLEAKGDGERGTIGIPRCMFFLEVLPFWITFFKTMGYEVVLSEQTNKRLIHHGVEAMAAETCFPIKVAHGHILDLISKGVKNIFLPSIIDLKRPAPNVQFSYLCPYAQTLAYTVHSTIDFKGAGVKVIQPVIYFGRGFKRLLQGLKPLACDLKIPYREIKRAAEAAKSAQELFYRRILKRGQEILSNLRSSQVAMVIVSRPYNGYDPGINLNLPRKLRDLNTLAIPMDFLPLDDVHDSEDVKSHYWRFGQKIMSVAELIKDDPRLFAIYITNFACGPDSFISHFFRERLKGKPYLEIEIDEHSSDVGAITRLEAFLDSLNHYKPASVQVPHIVPAWAKKTGKRKVFIPPMTDQAYAVAAAFRACGIDSEVLPDSDEETLRLGRQYTSGKECYPCILTTGDMIKLVSRPDFDPKRSALFMPSGTGPCRFGQYHRFHRLVLNKIGYSEVPIYAPVQNERMYEDLGMVDGDFTRLGWQGLLAVDILEKELRRRRPYEIEPGSTEKIYYSALEVICRAIENRDDLLPVMEEVLSRFRSIPLKDQGTKPLIGIVGEIYTRANRFANEDTISKIEALGGEVVMPPIAEWVFYINFTALDRTWRNRQFMIWLKNLWIDRVQKRDEHRLYKLVDDSQKHLKEPDMKEIISLARPYIHPSFRGESILSIGKAIDFIRKGASGIVNIMPFTCMPGTIVTALMKRCREDHDNIPFLNMVFDGQSETNNLTRLEAFMYQVQKFKKVKNESGKMKK